MEFTREIVFNWWLDPLLGAVITFVAMRLGRVLLAYRNDYQPVASFFQPEASTGFNAIYQILFAPVAMVFAAIGLYLLGWNHLIIGLWTVSVWYLIWQASLILAISRWRLLDKPKFFLFHVLSILLSYFVYATWCSLVCSVCSPIACRATWSRGVGGEGPGRPQIRVRQALARYGFSR